MKNVFLIILSTLLVASLVFIFFQNKKGVIQVPGKNDKRTQEKIFLSETVIAKNLEVPWALAFLPDGDLLITERPGNILLVDKNFDKAPRKIATLESVKAQGEEGLLGIAIHPDFDQNKYVFLYYTFENKNGNTLNRVSRFVFKNNSLQDEKIIVDNIPGGTNHNGGRIKFEPASTQRGEPDSFLYIGTGDAQNPSLAQDKNSLAGKILRVDENGNPAPGNPFNNRVFSYGHRNVQGLAWDENNQLWATEHGSTAKDELNKIEKGGNYGWPIIQGDLEKNGMEKPVLNSGDQTWAPSGLVYQNGSFFFAGLRGQTLYEVQIKNGSPTLTEYFSKKYGRLRDIVKGPDGALYLTTSNRDGRGTPEKDDDRIIRIIF